MIEHIQTRRTSLARKLTSLGAALAIALAGMTAAAVPARAQNDDLAKILMGAAAVFIIGSAINNAGRAAPAPAPRHDVYRDTRREDRRHDDRHDRRARVPTLPQACAISVSGNPAVYYGQRCLEREGLRAHLPQRCARTMNTNRGPRTVYEGRCMADAGFRIEGPRTYGDDRRAKR